MMLGFGPWGSDVLGFFFTPELKKYITFGSFICAMAFFLGYFKVDQACKVNFMKKGHRLYSKPALSSIEANNFSVSDIESVINTGSQSKRASSIKYSGKIGDTSILVYTNLKNAVTDVIV